MGLLVDTFGYLIYLLLRTLYCVKIVIIVVHFDVPAPEIIDYKNYKSHIKAEGDVSEVTLNGSKLHQRE